MVQPAPNKSGFPNTHIKAGVRGMTITPALGIDKVEITGAMASLMSSRFSKRPVSKVS